MDKGKYIYRAILLSALVTLISLSPASSPGQTAGYEEIVIRFEVPRLFQRDISAQYGHEQLYLPITEIFSMLDINVQRDMANGIFSGKFLAADQKFEVNIAKNRASCAGKNIDLTGGDYVLTPTDLYLRSDLYDSVFSLRMYFNFSTLSVYLPLNKDFPAYQKMVRKIAHQELSDALAAKKDLYAMPLKREYFKTGVIDWTATASPLGGSGHYGNLSLGGMLMGGDFSVQSDFNSKTGFESDQMRYRWHYYFDNNAYFTQAELGEINTTGYFATSMKGALITNRPQVDRRYFQTIDVTGNAGQGWEIELYVNNKLTDYANADANGDYNFLVDVLYGSSRILLKKYGPNGEIETEEKYISIPFNLIPKNVIQYSVAAGTTDGQFKHGKYLEGTVYYGLLSRLTAGVNVEAPIEPRQGEKLAEAGEITYQPLGDFILNGAYAPNNSYRMAFNFNEPSLVGISGTYTKFFEESYRGRLGQLSNLNLSISSPLRIGSRRLGMRYHISMDRYKAFDQINMNYGFNSSLYRFFFNYMGSYKMSRYNSRHESEMTSQLFLSTTFLRFIRPQVRLTYDHSLRQLSAIGAYFNKRIFRSGQLSFSFERNIRTRSNLIMVSFNIFSPFADFSTKFYSSGGQMALSQMQRGSVRFDQDEHSFRFNRKAGLGYGSAVITPFVDDNFNGKLDPGEEILTDLRGRVGGAGGSKNNNDKLYYYDGLRPYDEQVVQIDPYSLDNPQLKPAHENFKVMVNPNVITDIQIPVVTAGEVTGTVDRKIPDGKVGVGGIKVMIVSEATGKELSITTFNNGEYYYLGLVPGMYRAYLDREQLEKYGYVSEPADISFQIKTVSGGDYIDKINFLIVPRQ
ncbi:exported hypothetical protein [Candidatus Zixiibacteriota bacterium]|nr:exported hypothetical protein [candidate division Zixibacteria bacterium]